MSALRELRKDFQPIVIKEEILKANHNLNKKIDLLQGKGEIK